MQKTVLVTGASGNVGQTVVGSLAREGYALMEINRKGPVSDGPGMKQYSGDLSQEETVFAIIEKIISTHPSIEALVLLAGAYESGDVYSTRTGDVARMMEANFYSAFTIAQGLFPYLVKQGGGKIFFMGAKPAITMGGGKDALAYALSKNLLLKYSETLNAVGNPHHVYSTVLIPSIIDSPANRAAMPGADFNQWIRPEQIAEKIYGLIQEGFLPPSYIL